LFPEYAKDKLIRFPVASGLYYPEEPDAVKTALASFGLNQGGGDSGKALAVIAPHSAWNLSGPAAARAFMACRKRRPSRVVMLGMVHGPGRGGLFLSDSDSFHTPLGMLAVDTKSCEELASCSTIFEIDDIPHLSEHSIEVLLPFVKHCFPSAAIIPVLMGTPSQSRLKVLAGALHVVFKDRIDTTLFVIASCLANDPGEDSSDRQAKLFLKALAEKDGPALKKGIFNGAISGCGAVLAAALYESRLLEGTKTRELQVAHEKIITERGCVCFGSVAFE
jgi:AmmeMemoRadiSam system protein B